MQKKTLFILTALLFCLIAVVTLNPVFSVPSASAEEPPVEPGEEPACLLTGEHVYGTYTFTENGAHTAVCTLCGTAAEFPCEYGETPAYTANGDGTHGVKCILCGGMKVSPCEMTDKTVLPTQTETGYTTHVCAVCGYQYRDAELPPEGQRKESASMGSVDGDSALTAADARLILRAGLSLDRIPDAALPYADLSMDGELSAADARLALRLAVGLDADAERHAFAVTLQTAPVCTAPGAMSYVCTYCGKTGSLTVPATPHAYGEPVETPATCSKNGQRVQTCRDCGAKKIETLGTKGHTWTVSGKTVSCAVCSKKAEGFVTVNKDRYYCVNGVKQLSWTEIGGDYYFFDRVSGALYKNTTVDGLSVGADGRAAKTEYSVEKIRTFIKAKNILASITEETDSVADKKYKAFMWVLSKPYAQYRFVATAMRTPGFEMLFANDIFDRGNGCCGSTSYAFAFLAVEAGCHAVYVNDDGDTKAGHAWVTMEGNNRVYDVIFAEAKSFNENYDASVSDYRKYQPRMTYVGG